MVFTLKDKVTDTMDALMLSMQYLVDVVDFERQDDRYYQCCSSVILTQLNLQGTLWSRSATPRPRQYVSSLPDAKWWTCITGGDRV